jgi:hypothetical protein
VRYPQQKKPSIEGFFVAIIQIEVYENTRTANIDILLKLNSNSQIITHSFFKGYNDAVSRGVFFYRSLNNTIHAFIQAVVWGRIAFSLTQYLVFANGLGIDENTIAVYFIDHS